MSGFFPRRISAFSGSELQKNISTSQIFPYVLAKRTGFAILKDFILISFLWSLKNTMTILASGKKKWYFFVVIENLDQIVLKLSLMIGEGRQDVVPVGIVLLGRQNLGLISLSKISLILVWSVLVWLVPLKE